MAFILNLLQSLLYGFIMGITSWFPISSAAHMALMKSFLPLQVYNDYLSNQAFWTLFRSLIRLGGMAAVLLLYGSRLNPFQKGLRPQRKRKIERLWLMILISCLPAGILALLLDGYINTVFSSGWVLAASLILWAGIMFWNSLKEHQIRAEAVSQIKPADALKISLFRFVSLLPGIGHSASVMTGGELLGFSRETAAEYTFMTAVPAIFGAAVLRLIRFFMSGTAFSLQGLGVIIAGAAVCFVTSLFVIRYLLNYVRRSDLKVFAVYRVILGVLVLIFTLTKVIS